nr:hypothetical protein [uncultured Methanolobus sp.]
MEIKYQVAEPGEIIILSLTKDKKTQYSRATAMPFEIINSVHEDVAVSVDANC